VGAGDHRGTLRGMQASQWDYSRFEMGSFSIRANRA
jgi:hypothetical protein